MRRRVAEVLEPDRIERDAILLPAEVLDLDGVCNGLPVVLGARRVGVDSDVWLGAVRGGREVEERSGNLVHGGYGHRGSRGLRYLVGLKWVDVGVWRQVMSFSS